MIVSEEAYNILQAYARVFESQDGEMVLEDLKSVFTMGDSPALSDEAADIPHPYKAYFLEGGRHVLKTILAAVEHSKQAEIDYGRRDE